MLLSCNERSHSTTNRGRMKIATRMCTQNGIATSGKRCRYSSVCDNAKQLLNGSDPKQGHAALWDTYILKHDSPVGCDGVLFSPLVYDRCGVCRSAPLLPLFIPSCARRRGFLGSIVTPSTTTGVRRRQHELQSVMR